MSAVAPARRNVIAWLIQGFALMAGSVPLGWARQRAALDAAADRRWIEAAFAMQRLAESWGDQSYGAVVVLDGALIGEGPSRVVKLGDPDAHAEREAIRDAQRRLGRKNLNGAVLYSTSRPCRRCEGVAAEADIARMIHGVDMRDAGRPEP
jgi:tRNA(Arg) A34 adenosine deaminase TadA